MSNNRIYLDHNAAAPVDKRVVEAVDEYLRSYIGNSSSVHSFGRECRQVLTKCRDNIANYLNVRSEEIIFTSGGTEGANMVLRGLFYTKPEGHIITSSVEHSCVYNTVKELEKLGCTASYLHPGNLGAILPEDVERALTPNTRLIAIMAANHETGVKTDIESIADIAKRENIPFFVDGVALLGKEFVTIPSGVSAMSFSGQKIHAIQGTGFCFVRKNLKLSPLFTGGDQQFHRRAGTENLPGIVGLSKAIELLQVELPAASVRVKQLRDRFEKTLQDRFETVLINGTGPRVVNTSNICFEGVDGETLLTALDMQGIAASHGSACSSGSLEPSRILMNMDFSLERVNSSIRFSISRLTTEDEVNRACEIIIRILTGFLQ